MLWSADVGTVLAQARRRRCGRLQLSALTSLCGAGADLMEAQTSEARSIRQPTQHEIH